MDKPSYRELLEHEDWKAKRKQILENYQHRCQGCFNKHLDNHYLHSTAFFSNLTKGHQIYYCKNLDKDFPISNSIIPFPKDIEVYYEILNDIPRNIAVRYSDDYDTIEELEADIKKYVKDPSRKEAIVNRLLAEYSSKVKELFLNDDKRDYLKTNWLFVKELHVHHKYYRHGFLPWQYPNDALIPYCKTCHEELHKNEKVPVFNQEGIDVGRFTPCGKCCGTGYLPEYSKIENGICFTCNGAKYLELIE